MREVSGPPQQPIRVCGPGEIKGDSVCTVSGRTQVLLLEHGGKGSGVLDSGWERNRGGRSASAKTGGKEATAEQGEYVAKGSQQVQEGTEHNGGG